MATEPRDASEFRLLFEKKEKELVSMCVQKEKELVRMCEQEIKLLQVQVVDREKELAQLSAKFYVLKEDFKYNLELLEGRDAELFDYERKLSVLESSAKEAEKCLEETHQKLAMSEFQKLQERSKAEEKDKLYQQTLSETREQMTSLQVTREQLLTMNSRAFENAIAELMAEVKKKQAAMDQQNKLLEEQTLDKIRIDQLQSQLVVDGVKTQLSSARTTIKQLETDLREQMKDKDKTIKQLTLEVKQLQNEKKSSMVSNSKLEARQSAESAEHRQVLLHMKSQMEDMQRWLETAESRLTLHGERSNCIAGFQGKVEKLEREMTTRQNDLVAKIDCVEASVRNAARMQDQKVQDLERQLSDWKSQQDHLFFKYAALEGKQAEQQVVVPKRDQPRTENENSQLLNLCFPSLSGPSLTLAKPAMGGPSCGTNSPGSSSLPIPSPLISPNFSDFEAIHTEPLHFVQMEKALARQDHERDVPDVGNSESVCQGDNRDGKTLALQAMNHGTMPTVMEALQKLTVGEAALRSRDERIRHCASKDETKELLELRDEVHQLASELQRIRQQRSEATGEQTLVSGRQALQEMKVKPRSPESNTMDGPTSGAERIVELERVQTVLRSQLQQAAADITRMTDERDRLMEISNSLHADLYRLAQQENSVQPLRSNCEHCDRRFGFQNVDWNTGERPTSGPASRSSNRPRTSPPKIGSRGMNAQGTLAGGRPVQGRRDTQSPVACRGQKQTIIEHPDTGFDVLDDDEGKAEWLHLEGKMKSLQERPESLPDYVHKGIPSQRSKLQQSIKRRESQAIAQTASNRMKVRNYNIKDDNAAFL